MLTKSHGLGNDYLVVDPAELPFELTAERVRLLCDRHVGVGSDGLLVLEGGLGVRIFNPDGSEAEKSGNGLRIFARWLFDTRRVAARAFALQVGGTSAAVKVGGRSERGVEVTVEMGRPTFRDELATIEVDGRRLAVTALSIGNPHCVILRDRLDIIEVHRLGPLVEAHPAFADRTNVQLAHVLGRERVELLIWERGAGETLASGSSACAVVAACHRLGLVDDHVTAVMPGGELGVRVGADGGLWLSGPVEEVGHITLSADLVARLRALP